METLVQGLSFPEGMRWRDDRLWFSDMNGGGVFTVDGEGKCTHVVDVPGNPAGLGWLPDGRLLVVSMGEHCLYRLDGERLERVADLSPYVSGLCNDMVVDASGRAFIGNFGFDLYAGEAPKSTVLVRADPDGSAQVVATDMLFPNGSVLTADQKTLLVAETFASQIKAFSVDTDGRLSDGRVWASLPGKTPDGISLDAEGALWVASPHSSELLRVEAGGRITDVLTVDQAPFDCVVGGQKGKSLFIATSRLGVTQEESRLGRFGKILRHHF